jgi:hypothetical protein
MRYKVRGIEIRSENAAKPAIAAASSLIRWLCNRKSTPSALDYGCGKLRYTHYIAQHSKHIGIVDSNIQLTRTQRVHGQSTSVQAYAKKIWRTCSIQHLEDFWRQPVRHYHFILCANVLSTIPCVKARAKSLRSIYAALKTNGRVLFVNQHTNSYFTEVRKKISSRPHLDGWVVSSKVGASYYGILCKNSVVKLVTRFGFHIEQAWNEGQSNFVLVSKDLTI